MHRFGIRRLGALLSVALVLGLLVAGFSVVQAQQDDPTVDGPGTPRPGHIHTGTCAGGGLGDVVYALNNATIDNLDQDYESTGDVDFAGSEDVNAVYVSETTVEDVTLDDLLADDYAINFHLSGDEISTYIACGEIGGFARDGVLYVGLVPVAEFPDVQFAGSAVLTDNGDNSVTVVVQIVQLPTASGSTTGGSTTPARASTPVSTPIVTVPDESAAPSANASTAPSASGSAAPSASSSAASSASSSAAPSADESASGAPSVAPSADASADTSDAPSADASADDSTAPIESTEPEASASA